MKTIALLFLLSVPLTAQVLSPNTHAPSDLIGAEVLPTGPNTGNPNAGEPFSYCWTVAPWHSYYYPATSVVPGGTVGFAFETLSWLYLAPPHLEYLALQIFSIHDILPQVHYLFPDLAGPGYNAFLIWPNQAIVGSSYHVVGGAGAMVYWNEFQIPTTAGILGTVFASQWARLDPYDGLLYFSHTQDIGVYW